MSPRKAAILNIVVSIVFAAAIIVSSYLLRDRENSQVVTFLLIALWWIPFSILSAAATGRSVTSELACIKRRVLGFRGRR